MTRAASACIPLTRRILAFISRERFGFEEVGILLNGGWFASDVTHSGSEGTRTGSEVGVDPAILLCVPVTDAVRVALLLPFRLRAVQNWLGIFDDGSLWCLVLAKGAPRKARRGALLVLVEVFTIQSLKLGSSLTSWCRRNAGCSRIGHARW